MYGTEALDVPANGDAEEECLHLKNDSSKKVWKPEGEQPHVHITKHVSKIPEKSLLFGSHPSSS